MLRRFSFLAVGLALFAAMPAANAAPTPRAVTRRACSTAAMPGYAQCFAQYLTDASGKALAGLVSGYGPAEFHTAYSLPTTSIGNQTVAIVDAFSNPNVVADLNAYNTQFGLPAFPVCASFAQQNCLLVLNQNGKRTPLPRGDTGWGLEIALDVQTAHEICQNCRIMLIETKSNGFGSLATGVNTAARLGANAISNSYGSFGLDCNQSGYNHPNIAITVSSGDSGFGISCPANLNTVIAVGGTNLQLNPDLTYKSEAAWSGAGSGCSGLISAQAWQTSASNWSDIACGTKRGMNDVSADADPATGAAVFDSYGGFGWIQVGGTSLSAPLIAAVYALAGNASSFAYPAQSVYLSPSSLHDVTSGSSGSCTHTLQCNAGVGYDLPTGVGTPNGLSGF